MVCFYRFLRKTAFGYNRHSLAWGKCAHILQPSFRLTMRIVCQLETVKESQPSETELGRKIPHKEFSFRQGESLRNAQGKS